MFPLLSIGDCVERFFPQEAPLAKAFLQPLAHWPPARKSRLHPSGWPVEFCWLPGREELRYTLDIAGTLPVDQRLQGTIQALGGVSWLEEQCQFVRQLQGVQHRSAALQYGAWLGLRHSQNETNYKLYIEAPPDQRLPALPPVLAAALAEQQLASCLEMWGLEPDQAGREYYLSCQGLNPTKLRKLSHRLGFTSFGDYLEDQLSTLYGWPVFQRFPGQMHGISYAPASAGKAAVLTVYFFTQDLFAHNAEARCAFLHRFAQLGYTSAYYEAFSAPLRHDQKHHTHGMLGFSQNTLKQTQIHLGLPLAKSIYS